MDPAPPGSDPASPASGAIDEAVWRAMLERRVTVETPTQTVTGRLISVGDDSAVLVRDDGEVVSVSKREASRIRVASDEPAATPPDDLDTTPPPPDGDEVADETDEAEAAAAEEPKEHRRLGLFTSHGVGYARFRGPGGGAAYALDVGVGYNTSERFGVYGLIGGHVGASVHDGEGRGHFGHFAVSFRWKWKYFALMPGLGVGISGVRGPGDSIDRRVGFALPVKMMGLIPLPKELFLGIGIGYDLGILPGRQVFNGIALQVTVGRW